MYLPIWNCESGRETMNIPDNILKQKLQNVYFIWGDSNSGKTTTANELAKRYGFYVYGTDENRNRHFANADPVHQPALCREIHDYWALDPADANEWEGDVIHDFTPMVVADLVGLALQHKSVICEGDLDIDLVMSIVTHCVAISYNGSIKRDFFSRPDHMHMIEKIRSRNDLTDAEKEYRVQNAYKICATVNPQSPGKRIEQYSIPHIIIDETIDIPQMVDIVAKALGLEGV